MEHKHAIPLAMSKLIPSESWVGSVIDAYDSLEALGRGKKSEALKLAGMERQVMTRLRKHIKEIGLPALNLLRDAINATSGRTEGDESWIPPPFVPTHSKRHYEWCDIGARMQKVDILEELLELMRERVEAEERSDLAKSKVSELLRKVTGRDSPASSEGAGRTVHDDQPRGGRPAR